MQRCLRAPVLLALLACCFQPVASLFAEPFLSRARRLVGENTTTLGGGQLPAGGNISSVAYDYDDTLYVVGSFTSIIDSSGTPIPGTKNLAKFSFSQNKWLSMVPAGVAGITGTLDTVSFNMGRLGTEYTVFIGGLFTYTANGVTCKNICRYFPDTNKLLPTTGAGNLNGRVRAIYVSPGTNHYLAGDFTASIDPSPVPLPGTAKLVTTFVAPADVSNPGALVNESSTYNWEAMGGPVGGVARAVMYNGQYIVFGGTFTSVQKGTTAVLASNVAIYGGTSWGKLLQTCSLDGAVNAVGYTPNYGTWFGGAFTACGTTTLNRVATLVGNVLYQIGTPGQVGVSGGAVWSIVSRGEFVYLAGDFTMAGTLPVSGIAVWEKSGPTWTDGVWSTFCSSITGGRINSMAVIGYDTVILGGAFETFNGVASRGIVMFQATPLPTPTVTPTATPTRSVTKTASVTRSASATPTSSVSQSVGAVVLPSATSSSTITASATTTSTPTGTPSRSVSPTTSASPSVSSSATTSITSTASASIGGSASLSPSGTPSLSVSPTTSGSPSVSASASRSVTISASMSPSVTTSASVTPSGSASASRSATRSASTSVTPSASVSASVSTSVTPTTSVTPSLSSSASRSPSTSASTTATRSASSSPSVSTSVTPTSSVTPSISSSVSRSPSTSASTTASRTVSITPSVSSSASLTVTASTSVTPSTSASASRSVTPSASTSVTATVSVTPSTSRSPSISPSTSVSPSVTASATGSTTTSPSFVPGSSPLPPPVALSLQLTLAGSSSADLLRSPLGAGANPSMTVGAFLRSLVAQLAGVAQQSVQLSGAVGAVVQGGAIVSTTNTALSAGDDLNSATAAALAPSATCAGAGSASHVLNVTLSVVVPPVLLASLGGATSNDTQLAATALGIQARTLDALNAPLSSAPADVAALTSGLTACTGIAPGLVATPATAPLVVRPVEPDSGLDGRAVGGALGGVGALCLAIYLGYKAKVSYCGSAKALKHQRKVSGEPEKAGDAAPSATPADRDAEVGDPQDDSSATWAKHLGQPQAQRVA